MTPVPNRKSQAAVPAVVLMAVVLLATSQVAAVQTQLIWVAEQRITEQPDSSMFDWPAGTMLADARVADCLHVIWRDKMFSDAYCPGAGIACWEGVHKIGGVFDANSPWGTAGTTGICSVTGPNPVSPYNDNAVNIAVDGAGRAHVVWEAKDVGPIAIKYRMRESIAGFTGSCASIQSSIEDGDCSEIGSEDAWDPNTIVAIHDPNPAGARNSTICLYRPASGGSGPAEEILHVFYHDQVPKHRYRKLGNAGNGWSMGAWEPTPSEVIVTDAQLPDASLVNGQVDRNNGLIYATIHQLLPDPPNGVPNPYDIRFATSSGVGSAWSLETTILNAAVPWIVNNIPDLAITGNGDVFVVWPENLYDFDCDPPFDPCDLLQQRCVLRQRHLASGSWGAAGTWGPPVYFTAADLTWNASNPPNATGACVVEARGQEIHVAWVQGDGGTPRKIVHRYLMAGGDPEDPDHWNLPEVLNPALDSDGRLPKIYLDESDRMHVGWTDRRFCCPNTEIFLRFVNLNPTGVTFKGPDVTLKDATLGSFWPNPFRICTEARFQVPNEFGAKGPLVTARIYNVRGAKIRSLVDRNLSPGTYEFVWDGADDRGMSSAAGIYFLQTQVNGKRHATQRLTLLR